MPTDAEVTYKKMKREERAAFRQSSDEADEEEI